MRAFYTAIFILAIVIMALGLADGINVVAEYCDRAIDFVLFDSPEQVAAYKEVFGK